MSNQAETMFRAQMKYADKELPSNFVGIDFEFRNSHEKDYDLVCCVVGDERYWLFKDDANKQELIARLNEMKKSHTLLCYSGAEPECFLTLGLDPLDFRFVDILTECKLAKNENAPAIYGRQLEVTKRNMKIRYSEIPPDKLKNLDESERGNYYATRSNKLVVMEAKYLYDIFDLERVEVKERTVGIIINGSDDDIEKHKQDILDYCAEDVRNLRTLASRVFSVLTYLYEDAGYATNIQCDAAIRGRISSHYAKIRRHGIPIHRQWAINIGNEASNIIAGIARETNDKLKSFIDSLPDDKPAYKKAKAEGFVTFDLKERKWSAGRGLVLDALLEKHYDYLCSAIGQEWKRSEKTNKPSADKKLVEKLLNNREPSNEVEYALAFSLRTSVLRKLDLKGGTAPDEDDEETNDLKVDSKSFWGNISPSDFRSRAHAFPWGTQSGRCAPSTTAAPYLLPKFLRTIMQPPEGYVIIDLDFGSEEFNLSAIWARDEAMHNAYLSGDVYMSFGKDSGVIDANATKAQVPLERQAMKACVLGLSYSLGSKSLQAHLKNQLGAEQYEKLIAKLEAEGKDTDFHRLFNETYYKLSERKKETMYDPDDVVIFPWTKWAQWKDNPNPLSKTNCHIQGLGACILHACVERLHRSNFDIVFTLHDAIACMVRIEEWEARMKDMINIMTDTYDKIVYHAHPWEKIKNGTGIRISADVYGWGLPVDMARKTHRGEELRLSPVFVDPRGIADTLAYGLRMFGPDDFFRYILPVCRAHAPKLVNAWALQQSDIDFLRAIL